MTVSIYLVAGLISLGIIALADVAYISDVALAALCTYLVACVLLAPLGAAVVVSAVLAAWRDR